MSNYYQPPAGSPNMGYQPPQQVQPQQQQPQQYQQPQQPQYQPQGGAYQQPLHPQQPHAQHPPMPHLSQQPQQSHVQQPQQGYGLPPPAMSHQQHQQHQQQQQYYQQEQQQQQQQPAYGQNFSQAQPEPQPYSNMMPPVGGASAGSSGMGGGMPPLQQQQMQQMPYSSIGTPNMPPPVGGHPQQQQQQQQQQPYYPPEASMEGQMSGAPPQMGQSWQGSSLSAAQEQAMESHIVPINPQYMAATTTSVPMSLTQLDSYGLQLGLVMQPLAEPEGPDALPVVQFGVSGVVRCNQCRAYISPYAVFVEGGTKWRCNICGTSTPVPTDYFSPVDQQGRRQDVAEHPELTQASYEIVATREYSMRQPMPPTYVFVIDVSHASVDSGMLKATCDELLSVLDDLPGGPRTQVGFITFDSAVHLYSMRADSEAPRMFVLPDLSDVFLPSPADMLVNLEECRTAVEALLESLPTMHEKTTNVESAMGPAVDAAVHLMGHIGGKMLIFLSGLPSIGNGRLTNRENPRDFGTPREHTMQSLASDFYKKRAVRITKFQISVDAFFFAEAYMDLCTVGTMCRVTGGQTYYYPSFHSSNDSTKYRADLRHNLTRTTGWESVIRVRSSAALQVKNYYGNFFLRGSDLMALPAIDSDKAFALELHSPRNDGFKQHIVSFQCALLYTTSTGERRIRVHNMHVVVERNNPRSVFDGCAANVIVNVLAKRAAEIAIAQGFHAARDFLRTECTRVVRSYQTKAGGGPLPPGLSALPMMILGLLKSPALREGSDSRADERTQHLNQLQIMGVIELETFVRPRMLPVHNLVEADAGVQEGEHGFIKLPEELPLSSDQLSSDSALLIDNGAAFYLRLGRQLSPNWLMEVFGIDSLDNVDTSHLSLCEPPSPDSPCGRLNNTLEFLRSLNPVYQKLHIFKEGDSTESVFYSQLIEDRSLGQMSLSEFHKVLGL